MKKNKLRVLLYRLSRRLYMFARSDVLQSYNFNKNILIQFFLKSKSITLVDIGSNNGAWTEGSIKILRDNGIDFRIFAFEPCDLFYQSLLKKFFNNKNIFISDLAMSDKNSIAKLYFDNPPIGTSSLIFSPKSQSCNVKTISFDSWLKKTELEQVDLVKSDVEGYDFKVLKGASKALSEGRVGTWMFEYNYRWIDNRFYLRDVFDFIANKPYEIAKMGSSLQIYRQWNQELERFFEANFVLIRNDLLDKFKVDYMKFNSSNVPDIDTSLDL